MAEQFASSGSPRPDCDRVADERLQSARPETMGPVDRMVGQFEPRGSASRAAPRSVLAPRRSPSTRPTTDFARLVSTRNAPVTSWPLSVTVRPSVVARLDFDEGVAAADHVGPAREHADGQRALCAPVTARAPTLPETHCRNRRRSCDSHLSPLQDKESGQLLLPERSVISLIADPADFLHRPRSPLPSPRPQARSNSAAAPCPPPTHIVTTP